MEIEDKKLRDTLIEEIIEEIELRVEHDNLRPKHSIEKLQEKLSWKIKNLWKDRDFLKKYRKAREEGSLEKFMKDHGL